MQMVIGAAIFAAGAFFGAWFFAAGQQMKINKNRRKIQEAILQGVERSTR